MRETIDAKDLREDCLYGCQRRICEVKKDFISNPYVYAYDRPAHSMLWPGGFFQLFHSSHPVMMRGTQFVEGMEINTLSDNPDSLFAMEFEYHSMIKDFDVLHIGKYDIINWNGRKSERW